jgi:streptogrisin C
MRRTSFRAITVATAAATLLAASITAATAGTAAGSDKPDVAGYAPGLVAAMERDLGLTTEQAVSRLKIDESLSDKQHTIIKSLDKGYAGAWVDGDELFVAVTDKAGAAEVRASLSQLDRLATKAHRAASGAKVAATYVDVESNSVVMEVAKGAKGAVAAAVKHAGVPAGSVSVVEVAEMPRTLINVVGGNAYYIGGSRCSVGFSATGGFVTAGHCGSRGATTSQPSGTFQVSSFPGNDYAYVNTGTDDTLIGAVNNYNGGTVNVAGSSAAAVGSAVCRSGSTTGWRCGTIQALNSSVTYPQGTVSGLIRTNVCAEPGDSGGSLLAGSQAQGMTSGGSGNCSSGGGRGAQRRGRDAHHRRRWHHAAPGLREPAHGVQRFAELRRPGGGAGYHRVLGAVRHHHGLPRRAQRDRLRPLPAEGQRRLLDHGGPGHHVRTRRERALHRHVGHLPLGGHRVLRFGLLHGRLHHPVTCPA